MDLIVTCRELYYDRKAYTRGQRFTASQKDGETLKLIGKAEDAPKRGPVRHAATVSPPADFAPTPAAEEANEVKALTAEDAKPLATGTYATRRMKAKD